MYIDSEMEGWQSYRRSDHDRHPAVDVAEPMAPAEEQVAAGSDDRGWPGRAARRVAEARRLDGPLDDQMLDETVAQLRANGGRLIEPGATAGPHRCPATEAIVNRRLTEPQHRVVFVEVSGPTGCTVRRAASRRERRRSDG